MYQNTIAFPGGNPNETKLDNASIVASFVAQPDKTITVFELLDIVDLKGDMKPIYKYAEDHLHMDRAAVKKAIKRHTADKALGYYPSDVED